MNYLGLLTTNLHQISNFGRSMNGNDQSDFRSVIAYGMFNN